METKNCLRNETSYTNGRHYCPLQKMTCPMRKEKITEIPYVPERKALWQYQCKRLCRWTVTKRLHNKGRNNLAHHVTRGNDVMEDTSQ